MHIILIRVTVDPKTSSADPDTEHHRQVPVGIK